jgi:MscS family membrane protein
VPNNALADNILMNKSRMDHRRISWTIPVVMDARDEQIETVCSELRKHIEESGDFVTDGSRPCIIMPTGLSESSVDIMLYAFSKTSDWQAWLEISSRLVIALRSALKAAGTSVAYPTQTVHLQGDIEKTAAESRDSQET